MQIDIPSLPISEVQNWLQHAIAPRPICLASTVDKNGQVNLSPFSFFNLFSSQPPIIIFSPSRRVRDSSIKHTLENLMEVPEVVVNIVDIDMVHQVSLASVDYAKGLNEFVKSGLTEIPATLLRPPMVKESKIKMECRVNEIKSLGDKGGAGNLVIAEVLRMHVDDSILDEHQMIDQRKIHHVARLGGHWYCRVDETNLFQVEKPNVKIGIGVDVLPVSIRNSQVLSGNNLAQLGNANEIPVIDPAYYDPELNHIIEYFAVNPDEMEKEIHRYAKKLLDVGKLKEAWQVLLANNPI
jgi:flavin reductase (DIM6/NTAB) family NADH-FMN oxidoreductase RutF